LEESGVINYQTLYLELLEKKKVQNDTTITLKIFLMNNINNSSNINNNNNNNNNNNSNNFEVNNESNNNNSSANIEHVESGEKNLTECEIIVNSFDTITSVRDEIGFF
jgi:hypothetical protein